MSDLLVAILDQNYLGQANYTVVAKNGKNIVLCWIPSHVGILGNVKADSAAKSALFICYSDEASC